MEAQEIAALAGCTPRTVYNFRAGQGFSKKLAVRLEKKTGKHRLYWMFPGEFDEQGNPLPATEEAQAC